MMNQILKHFFDFKKYRPTFDVHFVNIFGTRLINSLLWKSLRPAEYGVPEAGTILGTSVISCIGYCGHTSKKSFLNELLLLVDVHIGHVIVVLVRVVDVESITTYYTRYGSWQRVDHTSPTDDHLFFGSI